MRISEYKMLMRNRRAEMRQLWCRDGSSANAVGANGKRTLERLQKSIFLKICLFSFFCIAKCAF